MALRWPSICKMGFSQGEPPSCTDALAVAMFCTVLGLHTYQV